MESDLVWIHFITVSDVAQIPSQICLRQFNQSSP